MRNFILIILLALISAQVKSQEVPVYSQYLLNKYLINPAFAGSEFYGISIRATDRHQWIGVDGAPQTQTLNVNGSFMNYNAVSLLITNDMHGLFSNIGAQISYTRHVRLENKNNKRLAFSIAGRANRYSFSVTGLESVNDRPGVLIPDSGIKPNASAGILYYSDGGYLGLSAEGLIMPSVQISTKEEVWPVTIFGIVGIRKKIGLAHIIEPSVVIKTTKDFKPLFDFNVKYHYMEKIWLGASYKTRNAVQVLAGMRLGEVQIAYAYEYSFVPFMLNTLGTHEFMIGYNITMKRGQDKSMLCPAYY